ncbi:hypothetical protein FRACA_30038 [Frankia canadensis]|uniref:Uncharacterized protein n=1 Tax=Frankia canadensis TaxID=1836972 RepID=A0A2I2KTN7_9ACTN|nr:hypothetical protein FRACA_30038 [Frankia canadensis]SOU56324.1 hypothetical protein FRACA_30038 [Frankia canadensis]
MVDGGPQDASRRRFGPGADSCTVGSTVFRAADAPGGPARRIVRGQNLGEGYPNRGPWVRTVMS